MTEKFKIQCTMGENSVELTEEKYPNLKFMNAKQIREILKANDNWRFILTNVSDKVNIYEDRIIGESVEEYVPIERLMLDTASGKELILTDVTKKINTDLIGFACQNFTDDDLSISCELNNDTRVAHINEGKFAPVMLTDVISTNRNLGVKYKNVCICCKDSAVQFKITCKGSLGFYYKAKISTGEVINTVFLHWAKDIHNTTATTVLNYWSSNATIVMKPLYDSQKFDPEKSFVKVNFNAGDLLSWSDTNDSKIYHINDYKRNSTSEQETVEGGSVVPGVPTQGEKVDIRCGNWIVREVTPLDPNKNSVDVYFFVFNTLDDAKKYFSRYNKYLIKS